MSHLARALLARTASAAPHQARAIHTTQVLKAATAAAVSSPSIDPPATPSSPVKKAFPARRTGYGKAAGSSATGGKAPPRLLSKPKATVTEAPTASSPSFDASDSFPTPQPLAELPDYANLAPPVSHADVNGDLPPSSSPSSNSIPIPTTRYFPGPPRTPLPTPSNPSSSSSSPSPYTPTSNPKYNDWTTSFHGLSIAPFEPNVAEVLMRPLRVADVEVKPDGLLYLPEIKYRRTLNEAFGPGGWGLAPRSETEVGPRNVSREWGLVCLGRLVAIARGEQEYFDPSGVPTATEACKSNALMRCCKDLGIASELWDPAFIREFKRKHCTEAFVEHVVQKKKRKLWRKNDANFEYPYKET